MFLNFRGTQNQRASFTLNSVDFPSKRHELFKQRQNDFLAWNGDELQLFGITMIVSRTEQASL